MPDTPLAPAPQPSPPTAVDLSPTDLYQVGTDFIAAQAEVARQLSALHDGLVANAGALGGDNSARTFARTYASAARDAFAGYIKIHTMLGAIGQGLAVSAENHRKAAEMSTPPGHPASAAFAPLRPDPTLAQPDVPPVTGSAHSWIPHQIEALWPSFDPGKTDGLMQAFYVAARSIEDTLNRLYGDVRSLIANNDSDDIRALDEFFGRLADSGDTTLFARQPAALQALGAAIASYESAVREHQGEFEQAILEAAKEVAGAVVLIVVVDIITDGLATLFSGPEAAAIADAAAARLAPVAARLVMAIEGSGELRAASEAAQELTTAIARSPEPELEAADATGIADADLPATEAEGTQGPGVIETPRGRPGTLDDLNPEQARNYRRYVKKLPAKAEDVQVEMLEDGGVRLSAKVPANNIPGSYAEYIKVVDNDGRSLQYVKDTYAPDGRVVHSKLK